MTGKTTTDAPATVRETRPDLERGLRVIRETAKKLSGQPGVYRMLDHAGEALYVGKAKSLNKRVMSHTRVNALGTRLMRMVAETRSMEIVTTRTEVEALPLDRSHQDDDAAFQYSAS